MSAIEARELVSSTNVACLATLTQAHGPWASLVAFADLRDGSPVICISSLAEHGRNLQRNHRASLLIAGHAPGDDPLATPRVTLAGRMQRPSGGMADAARVAYLTMVPGADAYVGFGDFTMYVMHVETIRWVGGYGRMETIDVGDYAATSVI